MHTTACARPKDLACQTEGAGSKPEASPSVAESRSFGRAQAIAWLKVPGVRSLRKTPPLAASRRLATPPEPDESGLTRRTRRRGEKTAPPSTSPRETYALRNVDASPKARRSSPVTAENVRAASS